MDASYQSCRSTNEQQLDRCERDLAIETVLTLRLVFHQPLRQTEGLVGSIFGLMGLDLSVPDHSTLSRRGRGLERLRRQPSTKDSLDLVVDSTGLKVYGPGEWQWERFGERKTGKTCSAWKKLHLGIDRMMARSWPWT